MPAFRAARYLRSESESDVPTMNKNHGMTVGGGDAVPRRVIDGRKGDAHLVNEYHEQDGEAAEDVEGCEAFGSGRWR